MPALIWTIVVIVVVVVGGGVLAYNGLVRRRNR